MINEKLTKELQEQITENKNEIDNIEKDFLYSTNEIATNEKWVDGRTIYKKSYTGNCSVGTKKLDTLPDLDMIIHGYGHCISDYDWSWNIPYSGGGDYSNNYRFSTNDKQLQLTFGSYYNNNQEFVFTIKYVKINKKN